MDSHSVPILVVCETYDQLRNVKQDHPDDLVIVAGTRIFGFRFSGIIDLTYQTLTGEAAEKRDVWWADVKARLVD